MEDDNGNGGDVHESPEDFNGEAAAGSAGGLKCTPCEHGTGISQTTAGAAGKPTSKEVG